MAVLQISWDGVDFASATSFDRTLTGITAGQLLVHFVACRADGNPSMADTNWIRCMPDPPTGRIGVWYKIADGTETTLNYTTAIAGQSESLVVKCSGADPKTALDLTSENSGTGTSLDTGPLSRPSAPDSSGLAYSFFTFEGTVTDWNTPGAGWVEQAQGGTSTPSPYLLYKFMYKATAGAEQLQATVLTSTSHTWQAVLVSFKVPLPPNLPSPMQSVG